MAGPNRIAASRKTDFPKTRLTDYILGGEEIPAGRVLHFGQVISSNDPQNANRLRVRIPLLDDPFYVDDSGNIVEGIGDDSLPFCLSSNNRVIDTPENGSVVVVALFDPLSPYLGRVWLCAVPELNSTDIFDSTRLKGELELQKWQNAENSVGVRFNNSPELRGRQAIRSKQRQVNYKTGLRGKDKNKLLFDQGITTLVQNENLNTLSKLELTQDVLLTAKNLELVSTNSSTRHDPVFADPLFKYLDSVNSLLQNIISVMTTVPSTFAGIPNTPSPQALQLPAKITQLKGKLTKLKQPGNGKSRFISIN